jgi:hypothetical protein
MTPSQRVVGYGFIILTDFHLCSCGAIPQAGPTTRIVGISAEVLQRKGSGKLVRKRSWFP